METKYQISALRFPPIYSRLRRSWRAFFCWIFSITIIIYLLLSDVLLFSHMRHDFRRALDNAALPNATLAVVNHLPIKVLLSDPISFYFFYPTVFWVVDTFGLADSFVTPNMVTVLAFVSGLISGRLIYCDQLHLRQLGAALFVWRSWLDTLDGAVYRAQASRIAHTKVANVTQHNTLGGWLDIVLDVLSGVVYVIAMGLYILKNPPRQSGNDSRHAVCCWVTKPDKKVTDEKALAPLLPYHSPPREAAMSDAPSTNGAPQPVSKHMIAIRFVLVGAIIGLSSFFWDHFCPRYHVVLAEKPLSSLKAIRQYDIFASVSLYFVFYGWRILAGFTLLLYANIFTFVDRVWELTTFFICGILPCLVCLIFASELYLNYMIDYIGFDH